LNFRSLFLCFVAALFATTVFFDDIASAQFTSPSKPEYRTYLINCQNAYKKLRKADKKLPFGVCFYYDNVAYPYANTYPTLKKRDAAIKAIENDGGIALSKF
jgi:hypothetical protein